MDRNFYYIGIAFFGMVNGLFNQALVPFAYLFAYLNSTRTVIPQRSAGSCCGRVTVAV